MSESWSIVKVGIADFKTVKAPNIIKTTGLGSCLGVVLYDSDRQIAGLAHIMLPDSRMAKGANRHVFKYADTAIDSMIEELFLIGAAKWALKAKIAGGAQMFDFALNQKLTQIGTGNVQAVQKKLHEHNIALMARDIGGKYGRTIEFDLASETLKVSMIHKGESII